MTHWEAVQAGGDGEVLQRGGEVTMPPENKVPGALKAACNKTHSNHAPLEVRAGGPRATGR